MAQAFFYCVLVALASGGWPLISRFAQLSPAWIAASLAIGTLPIAMLGTFKGFTLPPSKALSIGIAAGLVNGLGMLSYGKLIGGEWEISKTIPIALVITPFVLAIGARIIFGEPFTFNKIVGVMLGAVAIYFLSR